MKTIKIQCPAKINLNLKITGKLEGGFHAIESIMQTINLYDYLTINVYDNDKNEIILSGNSNEIPYDETNLVYKAARLYLETAKITNKKISIYIEKNIPVAAGMAGGSTDGAGVLYGLNKIFLCFDFEDLDNLCAKLGSDLNVCLHGGRILAKGRGEIITPLEFEEFNVSLIKPINLGISAKEAYTKFSQKNDVPPAALRTTFPLQGAEDFDVEFCPFLGGNAEQREAKGVKKFVNDLEWAVIDDYPQLQYIKQKYPKSVMTGSGSTYFMIDGEFENESGYWVKNGLKSVNFGVREV